MAFFRIKTSAPYGAEVFSLRYYRIQQLHAMWKRDDVGIVPYESARGSVRRAGDCEGRPCGGRECVQGYYGLPRARCALAMTEIYTAKKWPILVFEPG